SGSAGLGSPRGIRGAGWARTTGPYAALRPTPTPRRTVLPPVVVRVLMSLRRLGVEVGGQQLDELVEHAFGVRPLGAQGDLVPVLGAEGHDLQDARGVDLLPAGLGHLHRDPALGHRLGEQRGGPGVQAHGRGDGDGAFGHDVLLGQGWMVTLMASPRATISMPSSTWSRPRRWVMRSPTGTLPSAIMARACLLCAGLEPLAPTMTS